MITLRIQGTNELLSEVSFHEESIIHLLTILKLCLWQLTQNLILDTLNIHRLSIENH